MIARKPTTSTRVLVVQGALTGDGRRLFQLAHHRTGGHEFRLAPGDVGVDAGQLGLVVAILAVENPLLLQPPFGRHVEQRPQGWWFARGDGRQYRLPRSEERR